MCGRYYRRSDKQRIAECFAANSSADLTGLVPDYNVATTTFQPVIRNSREGAVRELLLMRWGLVPFFAKSPADFKGFSTFNAKAETVPTQPTWREPFKRGRRCLVPADGYYEWVRPESRPDDCPAMSRDRTCHPIGSTLRRQASGQRLIEKPSDNVTAAARLLQEPRGKCRYASTEADRG